jgi:hypothetical protein
MGGQTRRSGEGSALREWTAAFRRAMLAPCSGGPRVKRTLLIAAGAFAFAAAAAAQPAQVPLPPIPAKKPATPEEIAKARAYADQLIAQGHVEDVFENVTTDNIPRVRHKPSGMTCGFDPHPGDQLSGGTDGTPRTDYAQCRGAMLDLAKSMTLVRRPQSAGLNEATTTFVALFRAEHPDAKPYVGQGVDLGTKAGFPTMRTVRFVFGDGPTRGYAHIGVAVVGDWAVDQVTTGPADKTMIADLAGGLDLVVAIGEMVKAAPKP